MPISVHMFGLRLRTDCTQRSKNGQPAHSTTGVASANSSQVRVSTASPGMRWPNIASTNTASDSGKVHQKRRLKSRSSGLPSSSRLGISGSSAMPQIGQVPGPGWRISGCIGQMWIAPASAGDGGDGGCGDRYCSGAASNFSRQRCAQKW